MQSSIGTTPGEQLHVIRNWEVQTSLLCHFTNPKKYTSRHCGYKWTANIRSTDKAFDSYEVKYLLARGIKGVRVAAGIISEHTTEHGHSLPKNAELAGRMFHSRGRRKEWSSFRIVLTQSS
jgi:hypothetical protein